METTIEKDNIRLNIYRETSPINPRSTEWTDCNIVKMICFHSRYNLGDNHDYNKNDYSDWDEMEKDIIKKETPLVILPLYLYDHSGLTISTSSFGCRWDSGQIGFAIITKEMMRKTFNIKNCTKKWYDKAVNFVDNEVETYDQYLRSDVYSYVVYENDEEIDSCCGFYGDNFWKNGMYGNVPNNIIENLKTELERVFGSCP